MNGMINHILFIGTILLSICAGSYAIFVSYQLNKKYKLNYLSTYLYFQVFINVFGLYGILGQLIAKTILFQRESPFNTIETIGHFFFFLGIPFLIFAWYMFLRLCHEIIEKRLSRRLTMSYFFSLTFIFLACGVAIVLLNLSDFRDDRLAMFSSALLYLYTAIEVLVLIIALSQIFIHTKKINDETKQKAIKIFAYLYLLIFGVSTALYFLSDKNSLLATIHLLVFFSGNIPPILYWRAYLRKHYVPPTLQATDTLTMKQFLKEHNISKREEEVIRQLCEGKTNKEISETLFISLQTVKDHIYRIYQKTDVKTRVQLINLIQSYTTKGEKYT